MASFRPNLMGFKVIHSNKSTGSEHVEVRAEISFIFHGLIEELYGEDGNINEELVKEIFSKTYKENAKKLEIKL